MEKKNYNVPEVEVLCVESDVITSDSLYESDEKDFPVMPVTKRK